MSKKEELSRLQARKVALLTTMQKSDAHAAKCAKLGKDFQTEYPDDYAEYVAANEEYQTVEQRIDNLEFELSVENENVFNENGTQDSESEGANVNADSSGESDIENGKNTTEETEGE